MFTTREQSESRRTSQENVFGERFSPSSVFRDKQVIVPEIVTPTFVEDTPGDDESHRDAEEVVASGGDSDFTKLLRDNRQRAIVRHGTMRGRPDLQATVGLTADLIGNKEAGAMFGLSHDHTSGLSNGQASGAERGGYAAENKELKSRLGQMKNDLALKAADKLDSALDALSDTKITSIKHATNIARVAKDMAVIIDKVTKDNSREEGIHFHLYRPEMKTVQNYGTVHLNAAPTPNDGV